MEPIAATSEPHPMQSGGCMASAGARSHRTLRILLLAFAVFGSLLLTQAASDSFAQGIPERSAANLPFSGISPGGVNMATGELILVMRPDLYLNGPIPV